MAKILISSLGTGNIKKDSDSDYKETIYTIDGKNYPNTLTSKVVIKHFEIEKVFFVGTSGSMWDNIYLKYDGEDEDYLDLLSNKKKNKTISSNDLNKLEKQIDLYLKSDGSKIFLIDYDKNNADEIWTNFEKLLEIATYLKDKDEIYLDITHGFRYMPILNIFLLEFLSTLHKKDFEIKAILYGMFADNTSQIIDFKIFFDLLNWIKAINDFKKSSNADQLVLLSKTVDEDASKVLLQFSQNLQMANMFSLWSFMKNVSKKIKKLSQSDNKVIKLLSSEIMEIATRFDQKTQSAFQYELSKWLYENKNYALSYIALYEAIITKICETKGYNANEYEEREEAKRHIDHPCDQYFLTKKENSISKIRNSIVHQNIDRKDVVMQDIERLGFFIEKFEDFFNS